MSFTTPIEDQERQGNRYPQTTASAISEANEAIAAYEAAVEVAEEELAYAKVLVAEANAVATANEDTETLPASYTAFATSQLQKLDGNIVIDADAAPATKILIAASAPATTGDDEDIWIDWDADPVAGSVRDTNAWVALVPDEA